MTILLTTTIDGLHVTPKNRNKTATRGGRMGEARKTKAARTCVALRVRALLGRRVVVGVPRVIVTRLSAGTLDRGGAWEASKVLWDGIADGLGLKDDRELQERGDVRQEKAPRGYHGVKIEVELDT